MNTYAIIANGVVVNIIVWDGNTHTYTPTDTAVPISNLTPVPGIGWAYDGSVFTPPPSNI